ncbi:MAG: sensor histidine kinase [Pseudonocardiales bacterium]|nr:MAG: sensor histidine kinase [Pseudonocardiales bacterium]
MKGAHRDERDTAARRALRRLRRVLTVVFTATNALGLLVLTVLAVRSDADSGEQRLDGELRRVTLAAIQRLDYQADAVSLINLDGSGLSQQCPAFAVLPGSAAPFLGLQSEHDCTSAPLATLNRMALRATEGNQIVVGDATDTGGGHPVRMLAEPFYRGKAVKGAVVAIVDAGPERDRHNRFVLYLALGSIAAIGILALVGHLVSGRAMRPAANTLDQQERFLAESAHDLRTPLAAMRALAETALDNPRQRGELLPRTVALAVRMGAIVDDLLIRARLAAGVVQVHRQPVRLDQLVAGVVENTPAPPGALQLTAAESTVSADPTLVQRAVGNLIDNALKYGRQPGAPPLVTVTVADGRVWVADAGPGMRRPLDSAPFDGVAAGSAGASGLGLSIVRWIADAHGGALRVYNPPSGGAVFELALPVVTGP